MDLEALDINDIAPIIGNLQLTAIQQEKTIRVLRARIAELETLAALETHYETDTNHADTTEIPLGAN